MNFPGGFVVFLFFLASEERVPIQLKQVSIVGRMDMVPNQMELKKKNHNNLTHNTLHIVKGRVAPTQLYTEGE